MSALKTLCIVIALGLCACQVNKDRRQERIRQSITEKLDLPPLPPTCPPNPSNFPESVRIIRDGDLTLYFPKEWLEQNFVDTLMAKYGQRSPELVLLHLGVFVPDLHSNECPGVVHRVHRWARSAAYGGFAAWPSTLPDSRYSLNISSFDYAFFRFKSGADQGQLRPFKGKSEQGFAGDLRDLGWTTANNFTYVRHDWQGSKTCTAQTNGPSTAVSCEVHPHLIIGFAFKGGDVSPTKWGAYQAETQRLFEFLTQKPATQSIDEPDSL